MKAIVLYVVVLWMCTMGIVLVFDIPLWQTISKFSIQFVCIIYGINRVMCPFCSNAECYFACTRAKLQIKLWYLSTLGRKIKIFYIQALFSLMNHVPSAWFLRGRLFISFLIAALTSSEKVNPLVYLFEFHLTEVIFFLDYGIYLVNSSALVYTSNTRKYDVTVHCTYGYTVIESVFTLYIRRNNPPNFTNLPSKPKTWINNMEKFMIFLKNLKTCRHCFRFFCRQHQPWCHCACVWFSYLYGFSRGYRHFFVDL